MREREREREREKPFSFFFLHTQVALYRKKMSIYAHCNNFEARTPNKLFRGKQYSILHSVYKNSTIYLIITVKIVIHTSYDGKKKGDFCWLFDFTAVPAVYFFKEKGGGLKGLFTLKQ